MNYTTKITLVSLIAAATACAPADESGDAPMAEYGYVGQSATFENHGAFARLTIAGDLAGAPASLFVDFDAASVTPGAVLTVSGGTEFASASNAYFAADPEHSTPVLRAWMLGGCQSCPDAAAWQNATGTVTISSLEGGSFVGAVDLVIEGQVPGWELTGEPIVVKVRGNLDLAPTAPATADTAAPAPSTETTTDDSTGTEATAPSTQPAAPVETAPVDEPTVTEGPLGEVLSPVYEITLFAGQGVNFATGELVYKANFSNADLYATAGSKYLKLTAGGDNPTKSRPLRWFKNSGGFVQTFDTIDQVPLELPTEQDAGKSLVNAKPYVGFLVENHVSGGYTRVWIKAGTAQATTLVFQLVTPAG